MLINERSDDMTQRWRQLRLAYDRMVADPNHASAYLRDVGLKPMMKTLLGDCSSGKVLDVGTGGGWLFDAVDVGEAFACDLVEPASLASNVEFSLQDAACTSYSDAQFDVIASSLVLCYCPDIDAVLNEMARISTASARMVIALIHPYFYRTGDAAEDDSFLITTDLREPGSFPITIGRSVGPFQYYYRRYTDYVNALIRAGWVLERVDDWFMDGEEYGTVFPEDRTRSSKVPIFTFMVCTKRSF